MKKYFFLCIVGKRSSYSYDLCTVAVKNYDDTKKSRSYQDPLKAIHNALRRHDDW
jgi:hypothetical protein